MFLAKVFHNDCDGQMSERKMKLTISSVRKLKENYGKLLTSKNIRKSFE